MTQPGRLLAALGRAVREARERRGLSQEDLAAVVGTARGAVGALERGERDPSYDELLRLADAVGMPASALVATAEELEREAGGGPPDRGETPQ